MRLVNCVANLRLSFPTTDLNLPVNPMDQWAYRNKVELKFIQLGKPIQNTYIAFATS